MVQSTVTVIQTEPIRGFGYIWVQAQSTAQGIPTWSIDKPDFATIMPYLPKPDRAYIGGHEGSYIVTATYPDGSFGSLEITIVHHE